MPDGCAVAPKVSVRNPGSLARSLVLQSCLSLLLLETLSFLSEDDYKFEFRPLANRPVAEAYFEFPPIRGMQDSRPTR